MMDKLKSYLRVNDTHTTAFSEGGEYWHQDNSAYHKARAEHYGIVGMRAKKAGNDAYAELNTKLSVAHGQLAEYHQEAAIKARGKQ